MLSEDILFWTRAKPFRPCRITMNAGRSYEIRHPELVMVLMDSLIIGTPSAEEGRLERAEMIGLNLIDRIEPIDSPPPPPEKEPAASGKKK
jgi:hypothetical protein